MTVYNYDAWIAELLLCHFLAEAEMLLLCNRVRSLLLEESNIQPVSSPVTICGDIHGQFWDLLELLRRGGSVPETSYIFMVSCYSPRVKVDQQTRKGDFVDRGFYSLETISLLLVLKARYVV